MPTPPCKSCPWRVDATADEIPNYRPELAESLSACQSGALGAPMFGCHLSRPGEEFACAGWLAVHGRESIAVRLAVSSGRLDVDVLDPQPGWPELHSSYDEMMRKLRAAQIPAQTDAGSEA